jgi:hypothetical protein
MMVGNFSETSATIYNIERRQNVENHDLNTESVHSYKTRFKSVGRTYVWFNLGTGVSLGAVIAQSV